MTVTAVTAQQVIAAVKAKRDAMADEREGTPVGSRSAFDSKIIGALRSMSVWSRGSREVVAQVPSTARGLGYLAGSALAIDMGDGFHARTEIHQLSATTYSITW